MPRTKEELDRIKAARKKGILASAIKIFCRNGYDNTKLDDIMRDCGCSHGLMYHYFRNKDEIFREILRVSAAHTDGMYEQILARRDYSRDNFCRMFVRFLNEIDRDETFTYFIQFITTLPLIRHDFDWGVDRSLRPSHGLPEVFCDIFRTGQKEGWIRTDETPESLTTLLTATLHGLACQKVFFLDRGGTFCLPRPETLYPVFFPPIETSVE